MNFKDSSPIDMRKYQKMKKLYNSLVSSRIEHDVSMKNKLLAKKLVENSKDSVALVNNKALLKLNESISDIYEAK